MTARATAHLQNMGSGDEYSYAGERICNQQHSPKTYKRHWDGLGKSDSRDSS